MEGHPTSDSVPKQETAAWWANKNPTEKMDTMDYSGDFCDRWLVGIYFFSKIGWFLILLSTNPFSEFGKSIEQIRIVGSAVGNLQTQGVWKPRYVLDISCLLTNTEPPNGTFLAAPNRWSLTVKYTVFWGTDHTLFAGIFRYLESEINMYTVYINKGYKEIDIHIYTWYIYSKHQLDDSITYLCLIIPFYMWILPTPPPPKK